MKKLLLIMALFACAAQINAQSEWDLSYLGVKAGINYSTNSINDASFYNTEANYKTSFAGGLYCNIGICRKFAIQTEFLYSSMGSVLKSTIEGQDIESKLTLDYVSIPILFKFIPIPKLAIFAGPQFDFLSRAHSETEGEVASIKGYDVASTLGLEYWIHNNIGLYARYIYGISDINDKTPGVTFNATDIKSGVYNSGFQVGITLGLKVKKETPVESKAAPAVPATPVIADSDNDGVPDKDDKCPNVAGSAKYAGCPIPDTDGDGVNDEVDKCPNVFGTAKYAGCPVPDTDGDGVNDENDKCPNTPGIADNMGCPELIVYFQKEEAGLTDDDKAHLEKVVTFMNNNPALNITVEGHTSSPGSEAFNQTLSENRAGEVVDYLVSQGIAKNRMQAIGLGEKFPIGDNTTEEGKAKSRRVVIKIAK